MDVVKKSYRATYVKDLSIYISINGSGMGCTFSGGTSFPKKLNGTFSTTKPEVQAALEAHPWYNKMFSLVDTSVIGQQPFAAVEPAKEQPPQEEEPATEGEVYLSPAKNAQEAKKELNIKFNIPWSRLKNARQVKREAAERNIQYPNWMMS